MRENRVVVDGLTFPEGPRWYKDKLYFSDFFTHQVFATDPLGNCNSILKVPNQPSGFCLLYTSPSPRDRTRSRMPSSA